MLFIHSENVEIGFSRFATPDIKTFSIHGAFVCFWYSQPPTHQIPIIRNIALHKEGLLFVYAYNMCVCWV